MGACGEALGGERLAELLMSRCGGVCACVVQPVSVRSLSAGAAAADAPDRFGAVLPVRLVDMHGGAVGVLFCEGY